MINTWSKFIYGTSIDSSSNFGDFKEGATSYAADLDAGSRTLGELLADVQDAFNDVGGQAYTVSINRTTGYVTISAAGNFSILLGTGVNLTNSFWSRLGFTQGSDLTSTNTYTGASPAGTVYYPQFLLQSYVSPDDHQAAISPMVNRTMTGRTELVRFGIDKFIEFELRFITNLPMDGVIIKNNPLGVTAAEAFLQDLTSKSRFEFMPDVGAPSTFYKCVLDSIPGYNDGSGYKLQELFTDNLPGVFKTGVMMLRVVT